MKLWLTDYHSETRGLSFCIERTLYHESSAYQTIDIVETHDFGRVMLLDGVLMVSSIDEFVYHEMLSQPSLNTHPNPERVLIIGGGDCGTMRRVLMHQRVKHLVQVEIDEMVTRVAKIYFPSLTECSSDPRVEMVFGDGIEYLKRNQQSFDLILVDSTDPVGPAAGLFRKEFFADCHAALKEDGILCIQSESPWIAPLLDLICEVNKDLHSLFPIVHPYLASIQSYQAGLWMFQMASKAHQPLSPESLAWIETQGMDFDYYNASIHKASFALPQFIIKRLTI